MHMKKFFQEPELEILKFTPEAVLADNGAGIQDVASYIPGEDELPLVPVF